VGMGNKRHRGTIELIPSRWVPALWPEVAPVSGDGEPVEEQPPRLEIRQREVRI
jgi:diacylglycerol kinase family enzyme